MKRSLATLCILLASCTFLSSAFAQGMHSEAQIKYVKSLINSKNSVTLKAYDQLLKKADAALDSASHALADFSVPGYYIKPAEHRKNSKSLQIDAFNAYACALAYRLGGEKKYAKKACEILDSWATINKKFSEFDGSLVMAYSGTGLMNAALLLKNEKVWNKKSKAAFADWTSTVYKKACDSIRVRSNNWGDWGRCGSVLSASFLGDKAEIAKNAELIKSDIRHKISSSNGAMPEETRRQANGLWYTYFSLAPMTAACWVIYNETGENFFAMDFDGSNFKKALDYMLYYTKNPDEWPHYDTLNKPSRGGWPYNLLDAMGNIYGEKAYTEVITDMQPLVYDNHHFAWSFPTLMPPMLNIK